MIVPSPLNGQSMPISHMKQLTVCFYYTTNLIPVVTRPRFGTLGGSVTVCQPEVLL